MDFRRVYGPHPRANASPARCVELGELQQALGKLHRRAVFDLDYRPNVAQRATKHFQRLFLGAACHVLKSGNDVFCRLLAVQHHHVYELGKRLVSELGIGKDDALWNESSLDILLT